MEDDTNTENRKDSKEITVEQVDESLSDKLYTSVEELTRKMCENVRDIPEALLNMETNLETEITSDSVCSKFDLMVSPLMQWKKEKNEQISRLERCNNEIYAKWESAEVQREKDQAEIQKLKSQIMVQTTYCTHLGAVLGHLVWRASNGPEVINDWLSERSRGKILVEFLEITDTTIVGFFNTYGDVLPPKSRDEYAFVMGLLGTLANVTSSPEGRQLLIANEAGKSLIKNLMTYLPRVPTASGVSIKRLILCTLWNISVNNDGHRYLFELNIGRVVVLCLDEPNSDEIQKLGLHILQTITYDLEPQLFRELIATLPIEKIRQIAHGGQEKVASLARVILDYLANYEKRNLGSSKQYCNK